jgi:hypothetical protein
MLMSKTIRMKKWIRKAGISAMMVAVVALSFASKGGGGDKKKVPSTFKNDFTPIRTTNGFTLKTGPAYMGTRIFSQDKSKTSFNYNTVVTFQKGNTMYLLPYNFKVNNSALRTNGTYSNLQLLDFRIRMHK